MDKIYGINTVKSSLLLGSVRKLYVAKDFKNEEIILEAKRQKLEIILQDTKQLDNLVRGNHQGIIGLVDDYKTYSLEELINDSKKVDNPILVILDELSDPHNLGAIIRSGDAFSVNGIIYKERNSVSLNGTVAKVSTGAINYVKCSEVVNLTNTIKRLKKEGFWVIGLDGDGKSDLKSAPSNCPLAIVIGSEGYGISRLVKENCDLILKIPMSGHVNSLNASVACSIVLYELRTR